MAKRGAAAAPKKGPKAGGKKGGAKAEPKQQTMEGMTGGPPMQVPTDEQIVDAFEKLGLLATAAKSKAGLVGQKTNDLCDNQNFDKKALSVGRSLKALPDERFRITWTHLKKYAKAMGFDERADAQYQMFEEGGEAPKAKTPEEQANNVRELRAPRAVGETAGAAVATH